MHRRNLRMAFMLMLLFILASAMRCSSDAREPHDGRQDKPPIDDPCPTCPVKT